MNMLLSWIATMAIISQRLASPSAGDEALKKEDKPNIVLIFVDDMGYGDLSCYGANEYQTPHIDGLASGGMRFTNFLVPQAVCSASRAALLTGCYPNRVGITGALMPYHEKGLSSEEETLPEILRQADYRTICIGKWHLGHQREFLPLQHGFDEYFGLPYSNDMWPVNYDGTPATPSTHARKASYPNIPLIEGNRSVGEIANMEDQALLTSSYTKRAVEFIDKNKSGPFFLYLAHSMPHVPLAVSERFKGSSDQGLYGDVMRELDWSVGEVVAALEKNGLTGRTLIIFTSDNGPWLRFGDHAGSAGGLREGKLNSFEGGHRVPCILKWPGHIPEGSVCGKLASTIDLLPTISEITEAPLPSRKIDGVNVLDLLMGQEDSNPRKTFYYYQANNQLTAVRSGPWKLVLPHNYNSYEEVLPGKGGLMGEVSKKTAGYCLYNMRRDPGERYDVKELYPQTVEELKELASIARADLGDSITGSEGSGRREPGSLNSPE